MSAAGSGGEPVKNRATSKHCCKPFDWIVGETPSNPSPLPGEVHRCGERRGLGVFVVECGL